MSRRALLLSAATFLLVACLCPTNEQTEPADLPCEGGEVRLVGGTSGDAGIAEICFNGTWSVACRDSLDSHEAIRICKQLGYLPVGAESVNSAWYDSIPDAFLVQLDCHENEASLKDCSHIGLSLDDCTAPAAVKCRSCLLNKDLVFCPGGTIKEPDVVCIHGNQRCDGEVDCVGGEDELFNCASCSGLDDNGNIRLVDGQSGREGRLEFCWNGRWGTVCDDMFDTADALVVCRQLGLSTPRARFQRFGSGTSSPILLDDLQCNGFEDRLLDCNSRNPRSHNCGHHQDVGISCPPVPASSLCEDGDLRLNTSDATVGGRVEVCYDGVWGSICDEIWTTEDAQVACNQLGLPSTGAATVEVVSHDDILIASSGLNCTGDEDRLVDCPHLGFGNHDCTAEQAAGLYCGVCRPDEELCPGTEGSPECVHVLNICDGVSHCSDGFDELYGLCECITPAELRLVDGTVPREGRVEMCYRGMWSTVCDAGWDGRDAQVVCQQLGYGVKDAASYQQSYFGPGTGPIVLEGVACVGTEKALLDCPTRILQDYNCSHATDASVACSPCNSDQFQCSSGRADGNGTCIDKNYICNGVNNCVEGEDELNHVRLVEGLGPFEGRVEYCSEREWMSVCHDRWDAKDAEVVCRQLGLPTTDAMPECCARFGSGPAEQVIYSDRFQCSGRELNLSQCHHYRSRSCDHTSDAGVTCRCSEADSYPCLDTPMDDPVCIGDLQFCDGTVDCPGGFDEPPDCPTATSCQFSECSTPGEVRLVNIDGTGSNEGRVEICFKGQWGTVCDNQWDYRDAQVVCRQLGFGTTGAEASRSSEHGQSTGPVHLNALACSGTEQQLINCSRLRFGHVSSNCRYQRDAAVFCPTICPDHQFQCTYGRADGQESPCISTEQRCDNITDCLGGDDELDYNCPCGPEGAVRLADGIVPYRGRAEYCINKRWTSFCSSWDWNNEEAAVVCRQMGYPTADATVGYDKPPPDGQPVLWDQFRCYGRERNLSECSTNVRYGSCSNLWVRTVFCNPPGNAEFLCSELPLGTPSNVTELQFCDGFGDCPDGSDEPAECPSECSTPGEVRLVNGNIINGKEGRVEICFAGRWGTICDEYWDHHDAKVVCRQLGFGTAGALAYKRSRYGPGIGPVYLEGFVCEGPENTLSDCGFSIYGRRAHFGNVKTECRSHFRDASVACPALCPDVMIECPYGRIGQPHLRCISTEHRCDNITDCIGGEDELDYNCPCGPEGAVRLVDGILPYQGRVEICRDGRWATKCDANWDHRDATVVCRQLGYPSEDPDSPCCAQFGEGPSSQPVDGRSFSCTGSETNLTECDMGTEYGCGHEQDASVICRVPEGEFPCVEGPHGVPANVTELQFCDGNIDCPDGSDESEDCPKECSTPGIVRLVGGGGASEGRVEVCFGGQWGTVCDNSWDNNDAKVVCRQLGYGTAGALAYTGSQLGLGTGPVFMGGVRCTGSEDLLFQCNYRGFKDVNFWCGDHENDASVLCPAQCHDDEYECPYGRVDGQQPPCISTEQRCDDVTDCIGGEDELDYNCPCGPEGAVRLVGGFVPYSGRVEYCENGWWATVCANFYYSWEMHSNAVVVCRQLGYVNAYGALSSCCGTYVVGEAAPEGQSIVKDYFSCSGYESSLSECYRGSQSDCDHSDVATVTCSPRTDTFLCSSSLFENSSATPVTELQVCDGVEDCEDGSDEPEHCSSECSPGEVRLVNSGKTDGKEGRVEICFGGSWGTVCDDSWDYHDAEVVCRQLGFGATGAIAYTGSHYGPGTGPVYLSEVQCGGYESALSECWHPIIGNVSQNCKDHLEDASVRCPAVCPDDMHECPYGRTDGQQPPCIATEQRCDNITDCIGGEDELYYNCPCGPEGEIRLVDGAVLYRGRVEYCWEGRWVVIQSDWDYREARVACRQLGYPVGDHRAQCCKRYGEGPSTQPVLWDEFLCDGSEAKITDCNRTAGSVGNYRDDTSLICRITGDEFPCSDSSYDTVPELYYCDGKADCSPEASDEPASCPSECLSPGKLRLVNGNNTSENEGRVEICFGGQWGTVCDGSWDYRDASVVCRELGFGGLGSTAHTGSRYGRGIGPVFLDDIDCTGTEDSLLNCSYGNFGEVSTSCRTHERDASVLCALCPDEQLECSNGRVDGQQPPCISTEQRCDNITDCLGGEDELDYNCPCGPEGAVQLVDGIVPYRGRVEICKNTKWASMCGHYWGSRQAAVVCRQLGYPTADAEAPCCARFGAGPNSQPIDLDYLYCSRGAANLTECSRYRGYTCGHDNDASVICRVPEDRFPCQESPTDSVLELQYCDGTADCPGGSDEPADCPKECSTPGEVRLVYGNSTNGAEGRVEICFAGQWGTVCDDNWDSNDAMVVCRQLGFDTEGVVAYSESRYGSGTGRVHLDNVHCNGSEMSLVECDRGGRYFGDVSSNCTTHSADASVLCHTSCPNDMLKCSAGRVDGLAPPCIPPDQRCDGVTDCTDGEDEYCGCEPEGAVRLVGGSRPFKGRVEFCSEGEWAAVCQTQWDQQDAAVVCRQLGYPSEDAEAPCCNMFGEGYLAEPFVLDHFNCSGAETNLLECSRASGSPCGPSFANAICKCADDMFPCSESDSVCVTELQFCDGVPDCPDGTDETEYCPTECSTPGDLRLVNGGRTDVTKGRVELCLEGRWGTICDDFWDYRDAAVVCRQLGFGSIGALPYHNSRYGPELGPIYLDGVGCSGDESFLVNCSHRHFWDVSFSCRSHLQDAAVVCPTVCPDDMLGCEYGRLDGQQSPCISTEQRCDNITDCLGGEDELDYNCPCGPEGAVRLVDGIGPHEGRVEYCRNGHWTALCGASFDDSDAAVVCRYLGYPSSDAEAHRHELGPKAQLAEWDSFNCHGEEESLSECNRTLGSSCQPGEDEIAFVICKCPGGATVPCSESPPDDPVCVTELQYCDGIADCPEGSDEPTDCPTECSTPGEVRLVNGDRVDGNEGRVEICFRGQWGTVCNNGWDYHDARVVCGQLGYGTFGAIAHIDSRYGWGMGPVHLDNVQCIGSEDSLSACSRRQFRRVSSSCISHSEDAGVSCPLRCPDDAFECRYGRVDGQKPPCISTEQRCDNIADCFGGEDELEYNCPCGPEGAVRLVDGIGQHEGRVQICRNEQWLAVCMVTLYWSSNHSAVVCRQLGYPASDAEAQRREAEPNTQPTEWDHFHCDGSENNLFECNRTLGYPCQPGCPGDHMFPCSESPPDEPVCVSELQFCDEVADCPEGSDEPPACPTECSTPGEVRLVGSNGTGGLKGRVEICFKGQWGTVCDDRWDYHDAQVVCRQLGFGSAGAVALTASHYGPGSGPVYLDDVDCNGSEDSLSSCNRNHVGDVSFSCRAHLRDAAVVCATVCPDGSIECPHGRVDGQQPPCISTEQRCDSITDCIGGEDELDYNCPCGPEGGVQLVGGIAAYEGRVEICRRGRWKTVCNRYSSNWDADNAMVVCRQLGYPGEVAEAPCCGHFGPGPSTQPSEWDIFRCEGHEDSLSECRADVDHGGHYCDHDNDASVVCKCSEDRFPCPEASGNPVCLTGAQFCDGVVDCPNGSDEPADCPTECSTPGEVRLVNGDRTDDNEGRIEICFRGQWGTVCDNSWDYLDAQVICRQAGFGSIGAMPYSGSHYGPGTDPVHVDSVGCTGVEDSLADCSSRRFGDVHSYCKKHSKDASVSCPTRCPNDMFHCQYGRVDGQQSPCISTEQRCDSIINCIGGEDELDYNCPCGPEGAVRLVDGIVPHRGRVEYCERGRWTTLCGGYSSTWTTDEASVVCRQLGYPSAGVEIFGEFGSPPGAQPVTWDRFSCQGNETGLAECVRSIGSSCRPYDYASAICKCPNAHEFPCSETQGAMCVSELKFCDGVPDCPEGSDEPADCQTECSTPGEVRLVFSGSTDRHEGRVEICYKGQWGTVFGDRNYHNAEVVCQQVGLGTIGAVAYYGSRFGRGTGPVYLDEVQCTGSEDSLTECSHRYLGDVRYRDHDYDASVSCGRCHDTMLECPNGRVDGQQPPCISTEQRCDNIIDCLGGDDELEHNCLCEPEGAVRLVDGSGPHEGRVEFCRKTVWVTVCDWSSQWGYGGAAVVCRQLGYNSAGVEAPRCCSTFGEALSTQPVDPVVFRCSGTEGSLSECPTILPYNTCGHSSDANVVCQMVG